MKKITERQKLILNKHQGIVALYKSKQYTTEQIAKNYNVSVKQVQRVAAKYGVIRSQAEANKIAVPLKHYRKIPAEFKVKRKQISAKTRYQILSNNPQCTVCGTKDLLEVDHKDENPTNNELSNLQVLCKRCNLGKSHLKMYGSSTL